MALPVIVGAAAAVAARVAAKKAAQKLAQEAAKKAAAKTAQIAKNSVKTKPARKQVGNPPDLTKVGSRMIESIARSGGGGRGPLGKKKDARVVNAKGLRKGTDASAKGTVSAKEWARVPEVPARGITRINSAKPAEGSSDNFVEVPLKDTKYGERPRVFAPRAVPARKPRRKPEPNPANPPRGTVVIRSSSPSYLRKKAVPVDKRVVKKTLRKSAVQLRPKKK